MTGLSQRSPLAVRSRCHRPGRDSFGGLEIVRGVGPSISAGRFDACGFAGAFFVQQILVLQTFEYRCAMAYAAMLAFLQQSAGFNHSARPGSLVAKGWGMNVHAAVEKLTTKLRTGCKFIRTYLSPIIVGLGVSVILLGLCGFVWQRWCDESAGNWDQVLFKAVQLCTLQSGAVDDDNLLLSGARLLAMILIVLVAWKALSTLLRESTDVWWLTKRNGHTIICGLGRIGALLVEDLCKEGKQKQIVVIEPDEFNTNLHRCRELGAIVLIGDATEEEVLAKAGVRRASNIFAVTGSGDSNIEVAVTVCRMMVDGQAASVPAAATPANGQPPAEPKRLRCYVHIVEAQLADLFKQHPVFRNQRDLVDVEVFNALANSARNVFIEQLLDHRPTKLAEVAHYVILGFGEMGQCLAITLAQLAHFSNNKRCRMTIYYTGTDDAVCSFRCRYPRFAPEITLDQLIDPDPEMDAWTSRHFRPPKEIQVDDPNGVEYVCNAAFEKAPLDIADYTFLTRLQQTLAHDHVKPAIFVCLDNDRKNFDTAYRLHHKLEFGLLKQVPIFAWIPKQPALAELLRNEMSASEAKSAAHVYPFGECSRSCSYKEVTQPVGDTLAKAFHDDYVASFCSGSDEPRCQPWELLSEQFRVSNRLAADHALVKLAMIGCELSPEAPAGKAVTATDQDKELLAPTEHNRWVAERLLAGWQFGKSRVDAPRVHPDLIPFNKLNDEQRAKDISQIDVVFKILNEKLARV